MRMAGFDHTQFRTEKSVHEFFEKFGISKEPILVGEGLGFKFVGEDLIFVCLYNLLTGVRSGKTESTHEIGFAGYIGLEGDPKKVKAAISFIKENADCGELSPNSRDYI